MRGCDPDGNDSLDSKEIAVQVGGRTHRRRARTARPRDSVESPFASRSHVSARHALHVWLVCRARSGQSVRMQAGKDLRLATADDPTLRQAVTAWDAAGHFVFAVDGRWRITCISTEIASMLPDEIIVGEFLYGPAQIEAQLKGRGGANTVAEIRHLFSRVGAWLLADIPGGRDALRQIVHPTLRGIVDELEPNDDAAIAVVQPTTSFGSLIGATSVFQRVRDATGRLVGTVIVAKPAVGMSTLFLLTAPGDLGHFERIRQLASAGQRPAAVLFADLEGSAPLAKRLPTASYFRLIRRLTRAADECVVDAGGLAGRHAGDGIVAFFVAETSGSESAAARACIEAARSFQIATREIALRHDLQGDEITVNAGMHWGATLYIGSIVTRGRTEVTALGDEVNEAARIEACATGGRALASKGLLERLNPEDADAVGIDPMRISYTQLANLDTATEKARRDAPSIPVYDLAETAGRAQP